MLLCCVSSSCDCRCNCRVFHSICTQSTSTVRSQRGSRGAASLLYRGDGAAFQGLGVLGPALAVLAEFAEPAAMSSLPSLVLPRLLAPWSVAAGDALGWMELTALWQQ